MRKCKSVISASLTILENHCVKLRTLKVKKKIFEEWRISSLLYFRVYNQV